MRRVDICSVLLAILATVPVVFVKTVRWQSILRSQSLRPPAWPAFLAYFGSFFVGLLTPGRLGELAKAYYVVQCCDASLGQALPSVLVDRLFDLYALLLLGGVAVFTILPGNTAVASLGALVLLLTLPLGLLLHDVTFGWLRKVALRSGSLGRRLAGEGGLLSEIRSALLCLSGRCLLKAAALTALAYAVFGVQCYLLARALSLPIDLMTATTTGALGSLVTLLPISVSGLGTREAAMIAYLGAVDVSAESALGFSFLVFLAFHVAAGLLGAVAWWLQPISFGGRRT